MLEANLLDRVLNVVVRRKEGNVSRRSTGFIYPPKYASGLLCVITLSGLNGL